jgi:hypothetical protein
MIYLYFKDRKRHLIGGVMDKPEWSKLASNLLKAELKRRGISYEQLQAKLAQLGIEETTNSINVKVNRGTFSFIFFLQVMKALEMKVMRVEND